MQKFPLTLSKIQGENIVLCMKNIGDLDVFGSLSIDALILQDIKKTLKEKKSFSREYFLGGKKYKKLCVIYIHSNNLEKESIFLGKEFRGLPDHVCLSISQKLDAAEIYKIFRLSRYEFTRYKTQQKKEKQYQVFTTAQQKKDLLGMESLIDNICLARDLGETPACDMTPDIFAKLVKKTKFKNIKVKILTYNDIKKKKLGLIEGVGKGSENKPCMVILEHIVDKKKPTLGFIGKGVTFDTGGNQIKPGDFMYDMKGDMGGAAVVYATMKELDTQNIKKNIVACLCLAENVVSSNAYKPSDILTGYTGKTVEIIHTDAEGRLVMADGISFIGKNYKTDRIISIATLTGACMVALGFRYAGIMGTDRKMLESLKSYSKEHTEKYVELPFDEYLIEKTKSDIADYKNLDRSVHAGASMGATFLSNFLENDELYTHIDIAGAYINEGEPYGKIPKGMTGFGVESLSELLSK